jgi:hypothetical protein
MTDWFKRRIAGRKRLRPAPSQAAGDHAPVISTTTSTTTSTGLSQPAGVQTRLKALSPPDSAATEPEKEVSSHPDLIGDSSSPGRSRSISVKEILTM